LLEVAEDSDYLVEVTLSRATAECREVGYLFGDVMADTKAEDETANKFLIGFDVDGRHVRWCVEEGCNRGGVGRAYGVHA